jgi:hypothetical protein
MDNLGKDISESYSEYEREYNLLVYMANHGKYTNTAMRLLTTIAESQASPHARDAYNVLKNLGDDGLP